MSGVLPFTASGITRESCGSRLRFRAVSSTRTCWNASPRATSTSREMTYDRVVACRMLSSRGAGSRSSMTSSDTTSTASRVFPSGDGSSSAFWSASAMRIDSCS